MVAEGVAGLGDDTVAEGCKTRLDTFSPIVKVLDGVMFSLIGSNGDAFRARFSSLEFEGVEGGSVEEVGDTVDLFELIGHCFAESLHIGFIQFYYFQQYLVIYMCYR